MIGVVKQAPGSP